MPPITVRPSGFDSAAIAKKTTDRAQAAGQDWLTGVLNPRKDPKAAAIASNAHYKQSMQTALNEDAFLKGVQGIDLDQMATTINALGASVYTQGVAARQAKLAAAWQKYGPLLGDLQARVNAMPNVTDADRENKAIAMMRGLKLIKKQLRGQK